MLHVYDYLDSPNADPVAKEFLNHACRPAMEKDQDWLIANRPTVTWREKDYLCTGASRLGDVWLKELDDTSGTYYNHRVDITELSNWRKPISRTDNAKID